MSEKLGLFGKQAVGNEGGNGVKQAFRVLLLRFNSSHFV